MQNDKKLEMFKKLVPYLRGALWWARNELIKYRQPAFNQKDNRVAHPLLSVKKTEVNSRFGVVPMLVGTSGNSMSYIEKSRCILVTGMTKKEPAHKTYFGSIIQPGKYEVQELLEGVEPSHDVEFISFSGGRKRKTDEAGYLRVDKWYCSRSMILNTDKPMVLGDEKLALEKWCKSHNVF